MGRPMQFETDAAVDRAMDLFWRQGYAGTTPQELASELGIGKGSLYNTFESKHALFMRALRRYSERRLEYLTDLFSAPGPIRPRLKGAMTVLAGVGEHRRGCVMVNAAAELGTADDDVNRIADDLFTRIEAVVSASNRAGTRVWRIQHGSGCRALLLVSCLPPWSGLACSSRQAGRRRGSAPSSTASSTDCDVEKNPRSDWAGAPVMLML